MRFIIHGPFNLPVNDVGLISTSAADKKQFWKDADAVREGLSGACGCYIFGLQPSGGGARPWYVGRTKNAHGFSGECFQPHKINHYNNVLRRYERAIPQLILIAKVTPTRGNFARPNANGHKDVEELEDFLIGIAYAKNHELANIHGTKFLQNAVIPGVLNSPTGNPGKSASTLKALLGL